MPASRAMLKQCMCEECIGKGGYDNKGAPKGVLMAERSITSHIWRVKAERAEHAAGDIDLDCVISNLSVCTIAGNTRVASPVSAITGHLSRLTLSMDTSQLSSSTSSMADNLYRQGPHITHAVPVADHDLDHSTLSDSLPPPMKIHRAAGDKSSKKHNQRTMKALEILDNIESQIQRCFRLLLHSGSINDISHELLLLRKALETISQQADIVVTRKKAIVSCMNELSTQFDSQKPSDDSLKVPVKINTHKQ
ncbi:uncharacterized protein HD556DRAFT_1445491 [Suillus plorans]|uniref:Uncharacterized protein n=1 Tax=Suillus plorans TaxID=116603 RepID=A0A9P7AM20_9AGAM|nr:uncharacterized protein HD556DRAFT_1445491 [Suillus plorans]KAG1791224.1 hypothetical protein HD556DRAFT_1445491 [Suillus plorans]